MFNLAQQMERSMGRLDNSSSVPVPADDNMYSLLQIVYENMLYEELSSFLRHYKHKH